MRVMVIVKADERSEAGQMPSQDVIAAMRKFNEELTKAGVLVSMGGLLPTSRSKRMTFARGKRFVIDGPFTETKELIAGYWIWEVGSMEDAISWLERCPHPDSAAEGTIDIRPMYEGGECGSAIEWREMRERLEASAG